MDVKDKYSDYYFRKFLVDEMSLSEKNSKIQWFPEK